MKEIKRLLGDRLLVSSFSILGLPIVRQAAKEGERRLKVTVRKGR